MDKVWKYLVYKGETYTNFSVSNFGDLRNNLIDNILKPSTNPSGYYVYVIRLNNKGKKTGIVAHRAVMEAFIPNPDNLPQINHIDGNKKNNCIDNLEWCTAKQNVQHAVRTGLLTTAHCNGEKCNKAKLKEKQVIKIRELYKTKQYTQKQLGEMFNCTKDNIRFIVNNYSWKHIGE